MMIGRHRLDALCVSGRDEANAIIDVDFPSVFVRGVQKGQNLVLLDADFANCINSCKSLQSARKHDRTLSRQSNT
uniref:FeoA domain-containing protein n=1 Tax=Panagrellus redivivus TaxID=6233 RepID=A0A7E4VXG5_PANRE